MKKKVKLFTTIASLCLAVALMAFGVYAATSVSFTISSKVSFTVSDVFVNVTGEAYLDPVATKGTTAFQRGGTTAVSYAGQSYTKDSETVYTPLNGLFASDGTTSKDAWEIGEIPFESTKDCIVYKLVVTNMSTTNKITVKFSKTPEEVTGTTVSCKYKVAAGESDLSTVLTGSEVEAATSITVNPTDGVTGTTTDVLTVFVVRTLTDKSKSFTAADAWMPTVTIENGGVQA